MKFKKTPLLGQGGLQTFYARIEMMVRNMLSELPEECEYSISWLHDNVYYVVAILSSKALYKHHRYYVFTAYYDIVKRELTEPEIETRFY